LTLVTPKPKSELHRGYRIGGVQADGLLIKQTTQGKRSSKKFFIEIDFGTNPPNEPKKYNDLFPKDSWTNTFWADLDNTGEYRFPEIWIVTVRPDDIKEHIEKHNKNNLKFHIDTLV